MRNQSVIRPRSRRLRALVAAAMMAAASAGVGAGTVSKCLGAAGEVAFTSGECPEGTRVAATYDATPEPERPTSDGGRRSGNNAASSGSAARAGPAPRAAPRRARARAGGSASSSRSRCEAARAKRDATLARVGLKRTFDLLRKLDDEVRAACGG